MRNSTVTISQLQAKTRQCIRRVEKNGVVTISRHGRAVAFLISRDRMEAVIERLQIPENPKVMEAITRYEAGKAKMKDVSCLDEDQENV